MAGIRKASIADAGDIYNLETRVWGEPVTTRWDIATFVRNGEVLVSHNGGVLNGALISLFNKNGDVYVADLIVAAASRRQGIASNMYRRLFRSFPGRLITTDVSVRHREAVHLHEKLGFIKSKLEKNWYGLEDQDEPRFLFQYRLPLFE